MEFKANDIITCVGNHRFSLVKPLGSGGQGVLWIVKSLDSGGQYAFKIINEKRPEMKVRKVENIRNLVRRSPLLMQALSTKTFKIALPLYLYEDGNEFGYVMDLGSGVDINKMMLEHRFDNMPISDKLAILHQIAESVAFLGNNGLCYQDISHKNFMYQEAGAKSPYAYVTIIDCDNIAGNAAMSGGQSTFAKGTGFYMAPEVAFGMAQPSIEADSYALAVLFFKVLVGLTDSPYHGRALYTVMQPRPADMGDAADMTLDDPAIGYDWLTFIFDPDNPINAPDPNLFPRHPEYRERQKALIGNWPKVPASLQEMFVRAFRSPLDEHARARRPRAMDWFRATDIQAVQLPKGPATPGGGTTRPTSATPPAPVARPDMLSFIKGTSVIGTKELTCPFTLSEQNTSGIARPTMGVIEKNGNRYVFRSSSPLLIKYRYPTAGVEGGQITKGEEIEINNGLELFFSTYPSEKIRITLNNP